jgi:hypothetical protein
MRFPALLFLSFPLLPVSPLAAAPPREPNNLPEFVARYEDGLRWVERAYAGFAADPLPLRDEWDQPRTRRPVEDRRLMLLGLRQGLQEFSESPHDLPRALRLLLRGEALADDLFDLSQVAYDHEREELGRRLREVERIVEHHNAQLESLILADAGRNQKRLEELEKENGELRKALAETGRRGDIPPAAQP